MWHFRFQVGALLMLYLRSCCTFVLTEFPFRQTTRASLRETRRLPQPKWLRRKGRLVFSGGDSLHHDLRTPPFPIQERRFARRRAQEWSKLAFGFEEEEFPERPRPDKREGARSNEAPHEGHRIQVSYDGRQFSRSRRRPAGAGLHSAAASPRSQREAKLRGAKESPLVRRPFARGRLVTAAGGSGFRPHTRPAGGFEAEVAEAKFARDSVVEARVQPEPIHRRNMRSDDEHGQERVERGCGAVAGNADGEDKFTLSALGLRIGRCT